jgi:hypothetical protein
VVGFTVLFQATLVLMPGVFSTDLFSYLAYGQIGGVLHLNPYVEAPRVLQGNPLLDLVWGPWRALPSPYGPVWISLSSALAPALAGLAIAQQVLVSKLLMAVMRLVTLGVIWVLLGRLLPPASRPGARLTALTLYAWNPLALLENVGNAHNDGLMITLLLASLLPLVLVTGRPLGNVRWLGWTALITLSVLVKYATAPVGLVGATAWLAGQRSWRARGAWLAAAGLVAAALAWIAYRPWYAGIDTVVPVLNELDGRYYFPSLPTLLQRLAAQALSTLTGLEADLARGSVRLAVIVLLALYVGWELRRMTRQAPDDGVAKIRALCATSARILLVMLLLVLTEIHGWYFTWPLALVTLLGWESTLARLIVAYTLSYLPVDYLGAFDLQGTVPPLQRSVLIAA